MATATTTYEVTTEDGITFLVDAANVKAAHRAARERLHTTLLHLYAGQRITVTPLGAHGIAWHRD